MKLRHIGTTKCYGNNYFIIAKGAFAPYGYFKKFTFFVIAPLLYGLLPHCATEESVRVESNEEDGANPVSNRGLRFRRRRHQNNQEAPRLHSVFPSCLFCGRLVPLLLQMPSKRLFLQRAEHHNEMQPTSK